MADWGSPVSGSKFFGWSGGSLCVPDASVHTKGSWSDVCTLERSGAFAFALTWGQAYTAHRTMLVDVAIGSAGQEKIIINNLMASFSAVGTNASRSHTSEIIIPVTLPVGTLVRARCQSSYASNSGVFTFAYSINIPSPWTGSMINTYGASTGSSAGTTMTASNTSFTFGSYVEITSYCERMECLFVAVSPRNAQSAFGDQDGRWEVSVGDVGSEKQIAAGTVQANLATQITNPQWFGPYYQQVAEGQRLSARLQRQLDSSSQRDLDIIVYGVR